MHEQKQENSNNRCMKGGNAHLVIFEENGKKYLKKKLHEEKLGDVDRRERMKREYEILKLLLDVEINVSRVVPDSLVDEKEEISFCMNFINGDAKPLDEIVGGFKKKPINPMEPEIAWGYFYQLIMIVNQCHLMGILHRDIKPNNILIRNDTLFLIDFGLGCVTQDESHFPIQDAITEYYWSGFRNALIKLPEFADVDSTDQVRDIRSDIAQCVAVYWYMLTGKVKISMITSNYKPPFPTDSIKSNYILFKGLQEVADQRFQNTKELIAIMDHNEEDRKFWRKLLAQVYSDDPQSVELVKRTFYEILKCELDIANRNEPRLTYRGTIKTEHTNGKTIEWHFKICEDSKSVQITSMENVYPFSFAISFPRDNVLNAYEIRQLRKAVREWVEDYRNDIYE